MTIAYLPQNSYKLFCELFNSVRHSVQWHKEASNLTASLCLRVSSYSFCQLLGLLAKQVRCTWHSSIVEHFLCTCGEGWSGFASLPGIPEKLNFHILNSVPSFCVWGFLWLRSHPHDKWINTTHIAQHTTWTTQGYLWTSARDFIFANRLCKLDD
jgi:hypothetical protein